MEDKKYPYLGIKEIDGKKYVVFFTEKDYGVVVMDETETDDIEFGMTGDFDENEFTPLPPDQAVRLQN